MGDNKQRPFGAVLRDLLIANGIVTGLGNPNWSGFSHTLDGVQYETLRKAVTGERWPGMRLMERVAKALDVDPAETFWEYEVGLAQAAFDPREVGEEQALANLATWKKAQSRSR